jgi:PIN domain nuclease of toxin-antitoxin system
VRVLLDTHAVLWWFADDPALPPQAEGLIDDPSNIVLVSAASAWEVCTKVRIRKLPTGQGLCDNFKGYLDRFHFTALPISLEHARLAGRLSGPHKDPFDRMLAAQALVEGVPLVTNDPAFAGLGSRSSGRLTQRGSRA